MKIKLDENLPTRLLDVLRSHGYEADTVRDEGLTGQPDPMIWQAAQAEGRFLVTQDLDFSDRRQFAPGTHAGILLIRIKEPGAQALTQAVSAIAGQIGDWSRCFVVLTEHKLRVLRPNVG